MVSFEKLISRNIAVFISEELDLAGVKTTVDSFVRVAIIGGLALFIFMASFLVIAVKLNVGVGGLLGAVVAILYEIGIYLYLELKIDQRKNFTESILPDYLQITAANVRSGISLDKAMIFAARPEFKFFSE
ncbi:MAG: hypothetical protein KGH59_03610, partial [Candidatus Micrarchaeota archaeon]|nr:hypothetical protein [Candidatus Micrarchaeota archaeon]